jgi:hypothetical protein
VWALARANRQNPASGNTVPSRAERDAARAIVMLLDNELQHTHRVLSAAGVLREPRLPEMFYSDRWAVATQLRVPTGLAIRLRRGFRRRPEAMANKTAGLIRLRRETGQTVDWSGPTTLSVASVGAAFRTRTTGATC